MKKFAYLLSIFLLACSKPIVNHNISPKVITPDWSIAQVLIALDHPPVAMSDINSYHDWAREPAVPSDVGDIGLSFTPNPELLAQMDADVVIDSPFYQHLRPLYKNTPTKEVALQVGKVATWDNFAEHTRQIAQIIGKTDKADDYLKKSRSDIKNYGQTFKNKHPNIKQIAVVQFANSQNYRLYAANSFFQAASSEMGIPLYAPKDGNQWGFIDQNLTDLTAMPSDTCLIIISPFSQMLSYELSNNIIWQKLDFGHSRCMAVLSPVWIYGGVPSLVNFSQELSTADIRGAS